MTPGGRRSRWIVAAALLVAVAALWLRSRRAVEAPGAGSVAPAEPTLPRKPLVHRGPPARAPVDPDETRRSRMQARRWAMVDDAVRLNRFPPDSMPLSPQMTDVLHPYARHERPLPVRARLGSRERIDPETAPYFLLTGPRYLLQAGTPLAATLEAYRHRPSPDQAPERLPVTIASARVLKFGQPDFLPVGDLPLNDRGEQGDATAGDLVYGGALDPRALPGLARHNGLVKLIVEFQMPGVDHPLQAPLDFMMTAEAPAVFTGGVRERLTPAGLELSVQVDVKRGGYYFVQGLLFDARERPIGLAVARSTWEPGKHDAPLSFFGLLFHEAQAESPYSLRTLTGCRLPDDGEPFKVELPVHEGQYRTRRYALSDFSSAEHESPDKQRLIDSLSDLAAANPDKAPAAPPAGSPAPQPTPPPRPHGH